MCPCSKKRICMVDNSCIFCNRNDNAMNVIEENGYRGKKCNPCNLIYISPRPSLEQIANLYGHDQAHIPAHSHIAQEYPKKLHALHALNIIKKHIQSGDLLELGSGGGYFIAQAQLQGFKSHGIELNPVQAAFIRNTLNIPCLETPLSLDSFGSKTFDIIYHSDVLSHFYDPIEALHIIREKLKPGGYMIFETGNIADINPKYYETFNAMQYPDHLFFFGRNSMVQLLELTKFTLKEYHSYSILPQLRIMKMIKKLKKVISKSANHDTQISLPEAYTTTSQNSVSNAVVRKLYHYFMHTLRYQIGAYLPQAGKPQTVMVVAKK